MADKKKGNGKPREPSVPVEEFVTIWEKCNSLEEAKAELGNGASARAQRIRDAGVPLKKMPGGRTKMDIVALSALIGKSPTTPKPKKPKAEKVN